MLLPTGLQAKQLMDFCMMEMSHHAMNMNDSHDCCLPMENHQSGQQKNNQDCDTGQICACSLDEAPVKNESVVPVNFAGAVILAENGFKFTLTSPDEIIHKDLTPDSHQYSPPLYLQYDTFLI